MTTKQFAVHPGGTNPDFIQLTGTIISWWARTEGIMIQDVMCLRTQPFSTEIVKTKDFPRTTRDTIKHWAKLLLNAYNATNNEHQRIEIAKAASLELLQHRDRLVHSFWPYEQADHCKLVLSWIRPDKDAQYGVQIGEYSATVDELNDINQRFANLYLEVMSISVNSARLYG